MSDDALFAVEEPTHDGWPEQPRMLLSYAYAGKLTPEEFAVYADGADLIYDCGAFTAANSGKAVDHDEYLAWVLNSPRCRFAFSLDVIGDPVSSWRNYVHGREVLGDAVRLVPAWHIGSPWSALEQLCEATDYVAVGGAVPYAKTPDLLYRLARRALEIAGARGARVHGLGITGRRVMYQLPWSSVDSSSWNMFGRFSGFTLAERNGRMTALTYGQGPLPPEHHTLARQYGLDSSRMHEPGYGTLAWHTDTDEARAVRFANRVASARSFMYAEVVKRHTHPDFRLYLACDATGPREARMVNAAHAHGNPWTQTTTTTQEEVA